MKKSARDEIFAASFVTVMQLMDLMDQPGMTLEHLRSSRPAASCRATMGKFKNKLTEMLQAEPGEVDQAARERIARVLSGDQSSGGN